MKQGKTERPSGESEGRDGRDPTQAETKRGERRMAILDLIRAQPRKWTVTLLHEKFKVSRTTIHRDVEALRRLGAPIKSSWYGYYIDGT